MVKMRHQHEDHSCAVHTGCHQGPRQPQHASIWRCDGARASDPEADCSRTRFTSSPGSGFCCWSSKPCPSAWWNGSWCWSSSPCPRTEFNDSLWSSSSRRSSQDSAATRSIGLGNLWKSIFLLRRFVSSERLGDGSRSTTDGGTDF